MALADVFVAVAAGAELGLAVVGVDGDELVVAELGAVGLNHLTQAALGGDVVAGRVQVAGVETEAHAVVVDAIDHGGQLPEAGADAAARAGVVFEAEPDIVGRVVERGLHPGHDPGQLRLEACAHVRADVDDHAFDAELGAEPQLGRQRVDALGEQLVVGAGEVDQVDRVDEAGAELCGLCVGAEAADVVAVILASPLLGGGAEDLDRFGADLLARSTAL